MFLPESARWLLLAGKPDQAKRSLRWARGKYGRDGMMLDAEFEEMVGMTGDLSERRGTLQLFARPLVRAACVVACSVGWMAACELGGNGGRQHFTPTVDSRLLSRTHLTALPGQSLLYQCWVE